MLSDVLSVLTKDPNLTNALATVTNAVVAGAALFVSAVSLFVAYSTLKHQRRHNVLSVKPIPEVTVLDRESSLRIKLRTHGSGPLIVKNILVKDGSRIKESLIDWMPDLPGDGLWTHFAAPVKNRSLLPGNEIVLLEVTTDSIDATFARARDAVRLALSRRTVIVEYTDIYDSDFSAHPHDLSWFGREH